MQHFTMIGVFDYKELGDTIINVIKLSENDRNNKIMQGLRTS